MCKNTIRQIILDTETTGINKTGPYYEGHSIIEIGAVEIIDRHITNNFFHVYLKPNRIIDSEAFNVHGISNEFLKNKPSFIEIANQFITFIHGSELVIHNSIFDIGFINYELEKINYNIKKIEDICKIIDSLKLARKLFPGKRNNLDALCERYKINNSNRIFHGALIDAQILAKIFLHLTSGQTDIKFVSKEKYKQNNIKQYIETKLTKNIKPLLKVIFANNEEISDHEKILDLIQKENKNCLWRTKFKK